MNECWQDHCSQMLTIRSIFLYLDRTYVISDASVKSIFDMGLQLFRTHLATHPEVDLYMCDVYIATIHKACCTVREHQHSVAPTGLQMLSMSSHDGNISFTLQHISSSTTSCIPLLHGLHPAHSSAVQHLLDPVPADAITGKSAGSGLLILRQGKCWNQYKHLLRSLKVSQTNIFILSKLPHIAQMHVVVNSHMHHALGSHLSQLT